MKGPLSMGSRGRCLWIMPSASPGDLPGMLWGDFVSFGIFYERGGCIIPAATMYSVGEKRVWDQSRGFRTEVFLPSPLLLPHPAPPASNQRAGLGVTEKKTHKDVSCISGRRGWRCRGGGDNWTVLCFGK